MDRLQIHRKTLFHHALPALRTVALLRFFADRIDHLEGR